MKTPIPLLALPLSVVLVGTVRADDPKPAAHPASMPRDYAGKEGRPRPRSLAEVNAVLAGAPTPPEKTRPIRVVLVAGKKDHGKGEHDYPAWQQRWATLLGLAERTAIVRPCIVPEARASSRSIWPGGVMTVY